MEKRPSDGAARGEAKPTPNREQYQACLNIAEVRRRKTKSAVWIIPSRDRVRRSQADPFWIKCNLLIYRTPLKRFPSGCGCSVLRFKAKTGLQTYILHLILHPILHPKLSVNTRSFGHWCRKCRFFSKTFFWRTRADGRSRAGESSLAGNTLERRSRSSTHGSGGWHGAAS